MYLFLSNKEVPVPIPVPIPVYRSLIFPVYITFDGKYPTVKILNMTYSLALLILMYFAINNFDRIWSF